MSFEFLIQSIAQGLLVAFIIFGLIFEKRLVRLERKLWYAVKSLAKKTVYAVCRPNRQGRMQQKCAKRA